MAYKECMKCGQSKTTANYIAVKSELHNGSLPICRKCLANIIAAAKQKGTDAWWNQIDKICQWADVPFIPEEWEKIYFKNGENALGTYISIFRSTPYNTLDWGQYNKVYLQLEEENRVEDALPEIKEQQNKKLQKKWGSDYDQEELEYLENLHSGLLLSQNVVGALNEDQALKLCKISLIIEQKIRAGQDFSKDLKAYDDLAKLANLTPKSVKEANEFDSFGEVFAYLEKGGWKPKYYDSAIRDEVDNTEKNIKNWLRYLYTNETGIAEEIETRIQNLKVAAELEGIDFNEEEYREYINKESMEEKEEFKLDIM